MRKTTVNGSCSKNSGFVRSANRDVNRDSNSFIQLFKSVEVWSGLSCLTITRNDFLFDPDPAELY